jgi:hypothetical protein
VLSEGALTGGWEEVGLPEELVSDVEEFVAAGVLPEAAPGEESDTGPLVDEEESDGAGEDVSAEGTGPDEPGAWGPLATVWVAAGVPSGLNPPGIASTTGRNSWIRFFACWACEELGSSRTTSL